MMALGSFLGNEPIGLHNVTTTYGDIGFEGILLMYIKPFSIVFLRNDFLSSVSFSFAGFL